MKTGINILSYRSLYSVAPLCVAMLMLLFTSSSYAADAQLKEVLSLARSFLGEESSLDSVESLRFVGEISNESGNVSEIEIVMKKPCQQLQIMRVGDMVIEVGLNDIEAWEKTYKKDTPEQFRLRMAPLLELKRLRANCFENVNFYSSKRIPGRRVDYMGKEEVDGKTVYRVRFSYGNVNFIRNFDVGTGQLVMTSLENGEEIREAGNTQISGIRFPLQLITRSSEGSINTITFKTIEVNPDIDDSVFKVPSLTGN